MGVSVGFTLPQFDKVKHYYDPRNNRSNPEYDNYSYSGTRFYDLFGSNHGTVTTNSILKQGGYLNFPIPDFNDVALRGCEYHAEFDEQDPSNSDDGLYLDFQTEIGCTFSFWFQAKTGFVTANEYSSALQGSMPIFGVFSNSVGAAPYNEYHSMISVTGSTTSNPAGRPTTNKSVEISYIDTSTGPLPRFHPYDDPPSANTQAGEKLHAPGEWAQIIITGNKPQGQTNTSHDVWYNGEKIVSDYQRNLTTDSGGNPRPLNERVFMINSIGAQEDQGNDPPKVSFQGQIGPIVHWDCRLTDSEIKNVYNGMKPII